MSPASLVLDRLVPEARDGRPALGRAWLDAHGLPTAKDEAWRYTPVDDIVAALLRSRPGPDVGRSVEPAVLDELVVDLGGPRLVHVNGTYAPHLSRTDGLGPGLWVGGVEELRPKRRPGTAPADEPADGFHALNWAAGRDVAAVLVDADSTPTDVDRPLQIVHLTVAGDDPSSVHPRTVVRVGPRSTLHVVETHHATHGASVTNASTRLVAADGATVTHHRLLTAADDAVHVARVGISQLAGSTVTSTALSIGGAIVRTAVDARLAGEHARLDVSGLYAPVDAQRHDNVVTVDHAASHGTSTQTFRGIVDDTARGSFSGHVIVRPGTVGNDARQSNPNLVLDRRAQADTRPWLEIFADDVACTHGATVGRLDDDALFYLRSRGIPAERARQLLVEAFAGAVLDRLAPPALRDHVAAVLAARTPGGGRGD